MSIGDLQAQILGTLQKLGKATARQIVKEMGEDRKVAYTTVSTVLNRLYHKRLVKRTRTIGRGGFMYIYSYAASPDMKTNLVQRALSQLVNAFGPSIVPTIYDNLELISRNETEAPKRRTKRRRR